MTLQVAQQVPRHVKAHWSTGHGRCIEHELYDRNVDRNVRGDRCHSWFVQVRWSFKLPAEYMLLAVFFWVRAEELTRVCGVLRWKREEYLRWTVALWCTGVCDSSWKLAARDSGPRPFMHQRVTTRMVLPRDVRLGRVQDEVWHRAAVTWALQATLDPELVGCWEYARIQRTIQNEAWNKVNLTYLGAGR